MNVRTLLLAALGATVGVFVSYLGGNGGDNPFTSEAGTGKFFDDFASTYDGLNRFISLGLDMSWRRAAVEATLKKSPERVLDVGTGTGDVVQLLLAHDNAPRAADGLDPSAEMLRRARDKITDARATFVQGVAEALPFDDAKYGAVVASFGVRNFRSRPRALREMVRVLRAGGRMVVLEVGPTREARLLAMVRNAFVSGVMPRIAAMLSGHPAAYRYLAASMHAFPAPERFSAMLRDAGCGSVRHRRLTPFGLGPDLFTCTKS